MKDFAIFADALDYIEANLCREITQQDIARACCCSLSSLQKMWRCCTHTSIKHYISQRRLAGCAKALLRGEMTVTEIAFRYQYNSPEVFTRAFRRAWGVNPSDFRKRWKNADLFPAFSKEQVDQGGIYMGRKVDLSALYEFLRAQAGCYVLCFDVVGLMPINADHGSLAGDAVILEAFRRIDAAAGEEMAAFRIGGDEFALITCMEEQEDVRAVAARILSQNGQTIRFGDADIPVSVRAAAVRYAPRPFRYSELFARLQSTVDAAEATGEVAFVE